MLSHHMVTTAKGGNSFFSQYAFGMRMIINVLNIVLSSLIGEFVTSHVTLWLAVNLATQSGKQLLRNGLEYMVRMCV